MKHSKTVWLFPVVEDKSADREVWMNIQCTSTMQSDNTMYGPPEDARKGIVRIKANVELQNEGSQSLDSH